MTDKESPGDHIFASPGVRKLSRELDIDLSLIRGTGPKQRITKEDLHEHIKGQTERTGSKPPREIEKAVDFYADEKDILILIQVIWVQNFLMMK